MDLGLAGRVALVTGASKGIGHAIASALVAEGAAVAITGRSAERLDPAAAAIGAHAFVHDSADLDGIPQLIAGVEEQLGPVDVLVVSTGGPPPGPDALGFTREQWRAAYDDLVLAPMGLIEAVLPGMRERRFGRIVSVASTSVREPLPALMLSNSHRAATLAAFKTIARQVAGDGVTLNSVLPGRIGTDRLREAYGSDAAAAEAAKTDVPAGRVGTAQEFAAAAVFLCSAPASYVTGQALAVDGGLLRSI